MHGAELTSRSDFPLACAKGTPMESCCGGNFS
jgi:hypothetical protein